MRPSALKHAMYFGLLLGLIFCLNFFLQTRSSAVCDAFSWIIVLLTPYAAYRLSVDCRERACDGSMRYGEAFLYGMQLFFYASIVAAAFRLVYFKFLNPDFLPQLYDQTMQTMEALQMKVTDEQMNEVRRSLTPANMTIAYVWIDVIAGVLVSFVVAFFVKKDKNDGIKVIDN
jgi:hypothetical protein